MIAQITELIVDEMNIRYIVYPILIILGIWSAHFVDHNLVFFVLDSFNVGVSSFLLGNYYVTKQPLKGIL